jgi:hypothetical protein
MINKESAYRKYEFAPIRQNARVTMEEPEFWQPAAFGKMAFEFPSS